MITYHSVDVCLRSVRGGGREGDGHRIDLHAAEAAASLAAPAPAPRASPPTKRYEWVRVDSTSRLNEPSELQVPMVIIHRSLSSDDKAKSEL